MRRPITRSGLTRLVSAALCALTLVACDDEPAPPPVEPEITNLTVQCRRVEGVYTLDLVEFTVRDLDGVADIVDEPVVLVEATRLPLERDDLPWDAAANPDADCKSDMCEINFRWEYQRGETEQIYCGEDDDSLFLAATIDVTDSLGLVVRKREAASPL